MFNLLKKLFSYKKEIPMPPGFVLLNDTKRPDEYRWYYKRFDRKDEDNLFWFKEKEKAILEAWRHYWYFDIDREDLIFVAKIFHLIFGVKNNGKSK